MAPRSSLMNYTLSEQERFRAKLKFIRQNKDKIAGLSTSVADEIGCSAPNVYSVIKGNTFNAAIVNAAYSQVCRHMGILESDTEPEKGNPDDEMMVRLLAEAQDLRGTYKEKIKEFGELRNYLRRMTRDIEIVDWRISKIVASSIDDLSDLVGTQAAEYLRENTKLPSEPPSRAADLPDPVIGSTADVPQEVLDFLEDAKMQGLLADSGILPDISSNIDDLLPDEGDETLPEEYTLSKS